MKQKIISILFIIFVFGFFIISFLLEDVKVSTFERRKLAQLPKLDSDFTQNLDTYITEQFPLRNEFINLNSYINRSILQINDYNDVYVIGNTIYDINYPINEKSINNFCNKVNYIIQKDLQNSNVYFAIIPNKEYFLEDEKYLKIDYEYLINSMNIEAQYIDIIQNLKIEDYYRTDIHWKQESLQPVVKKIIEQMGNTYIDFEYNNNKYELFYGASYSKAGVNIAPDELVYLENEHTKNAVVKHLEYGEKKVYDLEKVKGPDYYDIYLSGASSFIEITNPLSSNNKELIIFRDSFASSLAPLLIPYYNKITLIDLRYINYDIAASMVDFENKDVLFIYSAEIINNSNLLKVTI